MKQEDKCAQSNVALSRVSIGSYAAVSESEIEHIPEYHLVKGESLIIQDDKGKVLYKNVRGFMLLSKTHYLVRFADGGWRYCTASSGDIVYPGFLKQLNVKFRQKAVMFDDRGKLRLGQLKPAYNTVYA